MQLEEYVSDSSWPPDVDLVNEISVVDRVEITADDVSDRLSVQYSPDEIISLMIDDWNDVHFTPVETTVLVVDEDEVWDHETVVNRFGGL